MPRNNGTRFKMTEVGSGRRAGHGQPAAATMSLLFSMAVLMLAPSRATAMSDDIYVSAFVSQGYLKTTEYDYQIEKSTNGSAEFNEAAVSLLMEPADKFTLGIQLFSRDLGDLGNNDVRISWAFGDYRWRDWLGFRGGKIKMQMGLYNIGREVDMLRTSIFLQGSVYSPAYRDFSLAHEGFSLYGSTTAGPGGSLDYEVFGGALNIPDPNQSQWKKSFASNTALSIDVNNRLQLWPDPNMRFDYVRTDDVVPTFPWVFGGALIWNTPVEGLRLAGYFNSGEYQMSYNTVVYANTVDPETGAVVDRELVELVNRWSDRYYLTIASIEYTTGDFVFVAEHNNFAQDDSETNAGQYVGVTWEKYNWLSLAAFASRFVIDVGDPGGNFMEDLGYDDYAAWQREFTLAARINLTPNWLIKGEFRVIDGTANVLYLDAIESSSRYWNMMALKTTFHF